MLPNTIKEIKADIEGLTFHLMNGNCPDHQIYLEYVTRINQLERILAMIEEETSGGQDENWVD